MTTVVLAPDKFKGTLTAAEVAAHLGDGLRRADPEVELVTSPVADGGDGTLVAALASGFEEMHAEVHGPDGSPIVASFARRDREAIVELASASGLAQLGESRIPLQASSLGTGELLARALDHGCRDLMLGIGGSASIDGGAGLLIGLGARVLDDEGRPVSLGGAGLAGARTLDLSTLHPALADARITVACDVDNPLLGPNGAAHVYGPQKGADPDDVRHLERALRNWADLVAAATGRDNRGEPGAGAAGGVGLAARAVLDASLEPGARLVLRLLRFDRRATGADLVVTGEGRLDRQTLSGKAPFGVARAARRLGVPVVAVAGQCTLSQADIRRAGLRAVYPLDEITTNRRLLFEEPGPILNLVGRRIAREHLGTARAGSMLSAAPTHARGDR